MNFTANDVYDFILSFSKRIINDETYFTPYNFAFVFAVQEIIHRLFENPDREFYLELNRNIVDSKEWSDDFKKDFFEFKNNYRTALLKSSLALIKDPEIDFEDILVEHFASLTKYYFDNHGIEKPLEFYHKLLSAYTMIIIT